MVMRVRDGGGWIYAGGLMIVLSMLPAFMICGKLWGYAVFGVNYFMLLGIIWRVLGDSRRLFWTSTWLASIVAYLLSCALVVGYGWMRTDVPAVSVLLLSPGYVLYSACVCFACFFMLRRRDERRREEEEE